MTLERRSRPIFARAEECDTRAFCIERCRREIQCADYFAETHTRCTISDGYAAAIQTARRRIRQAEKMPWLGYRFLGLDACWLSLLGFRSEWENEWPCGGIDAACTLAEEILELTPGTAGSWMVEDLFRLYCQTSLSKAWTDGGSIGIVEESGAVTQSRAASQLASVRRDRAT